MSDDLEFWVYMLKCADGSLYTGQTNDLSRRVLLHNAGKGAIFTRGRRPVVLVYAEKLATRGDALRKEEEIRKLSRRRKELLLKTGVVS
jgi:putative endonuclease